LGAVVAFLFKVGQRVRENAPPRRLGTIIRIYHPGPFGVLTVRLDGLGIVQFPPSAVSLAS
jgi:hypothetical protein